MDYLGKLHEGTDKFPMTDIWMDSCGKVELEYGIQRGCTGATSNPLIVAAVIRNEFAYWTPYIEKIVCENPDFSEDDVVWALIDEIGRQRAPLLLDHFRAHKGRKGRLSIQTNAKNYRNAPKMIAQAMHLNTLGENMQIKVPASASGLKAIEELTYEGVSINATLSFTVAQYVAVAEAVERGMARRKLERLTCDTMSPVCTIMCGRTEDWLKKDLEDRTQTMTPEALIWSGVAIVKEAYRIFLERGYQTRILTAANRNMYHWSAFLGGDLLQTINYNWQLKLEQCPAKVQKNIEQPVDPAYLEELMNNIEFVKAFSEKGQTPEEFERYGAFKDCLTAFVAGYDSLVADIRPFLIG